MKHLKRSRSMRMAAFESAALGPISHAVRRTPPLSTPIFAKRSSIIGHTGRSLPGLVDPLECVYPLRLTGK